jgi:cation diffusion facilitator family transporter
VYDLNHNQTSEAELQAAQDLRRRAAKISFAIGFLMLTLKMGGYLITNSAAILSDALESVVHVVATAVALYSVILVSRPANRRYPYGYGKAEYFSAGLEGALIVVAAIAIVYEATLDILRGPQLKAIDVGVLVIAVAGAINLALGLYLIRTGKATNSLVLVADGKHVLTDSYTSIGVLIGLILVRFTHVVLLDPIFAIAVAINILWTGYALMRESVQGLMNTADFEMVERTVNVLNNSRTPEMIDVHRLRAWRAGEKRFVDFHLTLPYYMPMEEAHDLMHRITDAVNDEFAEQVDVLLHMDPCNPDCCQFCPKDDCAVRSAPRTTEAPFTVEAVQGEPTHLALKKSRRHGEN